MVVADGALHPSARREHVFCQHVSGRVFVFGGNSSCMLGDMWALHLERTPPSWEPLPPPPKAAHPGASSGHTCVAMLHELLLFGGFLSLTAGVVWSYNLDTASWTEHRPSPSSRAPVPRACTQHSAVMFDGHMVVFGGFVHHWEPSNELWRYAAASNSWALCELAADSPVPAPRYDHACALLDDFM
jgi:hypothetical protein